LVATLEMLAVRQEFGETGVFSRDAIATLYWSRQKALARVDRLIGRLLLIQTVSSAMLILLGPFSVPGRLATALCVGSRGLVRWRRLIGGDGAEQITSIALVAALLAVFPAPAPARVNLAVAFIGGQVVLSYFTAGIAKLVSPVWRAGGALPAIMATEFHGDPTVAGALRRFPHVAAGLGWFVIVFECSFPLVLFGPAWLAIVELTLGLAFHLACAVTMGLNNFLLAFTATYPCVIALRAWLVRH
jgi:hypothetical protein